MVGVVSPSRWFMILFMVSTVGEGAFVQASPDGHAPHGTMTIEGVTVPDVGSGPRCRLQYSYTEGLGKQLYLMDVCLRTRHTLH